ncbi:motile sperm domain-containing protein 2-like [Saccostrea echinata]|uniref:motile sperm domain-containing protein 2-like n=1 Tax=Saccostrea echinata TaxID=191078 RepID=UPI002A83237A|nr:motile sperm domain-containing protein 2-like [Saccostrea echinata]
MAEGDGSPRTQADKLRNVYNKKYKADELVKTGVYDQRDVDNINSNDLYVSQFIRKTETIQDAADRLHEALKWRKEIGARDISESSFPREFWEIGAMYFHGTDKEGRKIIWLKISMHKKDPNMLPMIKKYFAYCFETTYNESPEDEIVMLFDMTNTGLSNLDMEMIKFVITSFKIYYPTLLGYLLIYEMPWLFNAAWKIVKTWLSAEAQKKLKFVSKNDIQEYIDRENLPEHMGGTDTYKYKYIPPEEREAEDNQNNDATKKKVTFADQNSPLYQSFSAETTDISNSSVVTSPRSNINRNAGPVRSRPEGNSFVGRLLTISPAEELKFITDDGGKDTICLKNTLPYSIAYKVKTTSPEKYKVRPSSGIVKPGTTEKINVHLHQEHHQGVDKDKFLIMAVELNGDPPDNLSDYWRTVPKENIMEHRLRCVQIRQSDSNTSDSPSILSADDQIAALSTKVDSLIESNAILQKSVSLLVLLQVLTLLLLVLYMGYSYLYSGPDTTTVKPEADLTSNSTADKYCSGNLF